MWAENILPRNNYSQINDLLNANMLMACLSTLCRILNTVYTDANTVTFNKLKVGWTTHISIFLQNRFQAIKGLKPLSILVDGSYLVVEFVEWRTAESEVSGSYPRVRFLLLEQKPVLYREWSGILETHALYR